MIRALAGLALLGLAACGGPAEPRWAPDAQVNAARYAHSGPPSITLYTMMNSESGAGLHSGLLINASERVVFDPAGTFKLSFAPERNDVHHGMTPRALAVYEDYYARETINVAKQTLTLTPAQAERVLAEAKAYGAVPKAQCTVAITRVLNRAGIDMPAAFFPLQAKAAMRRRHGAATTILTDDDADQNHGVLIVAEEDFQT